MFSLAVVKFRTGRRHKRTVNMTCCCAARQHALETYGPEADRDNDLGGEIREMERAACSK
jgi:hypothetical protein